MTRSFQASRLVRWLAVTLCWTLALSTSQAKESSLSCFGIFDPGSADPRVVIFPIAHVGMPDYLEDSVLRTAKMLKGPTRLLLETAEKSENDHDGKFGPIFSSLGIPDVSLDLREELIQSLKNSKFFRESGFRMDLLDVLPLTWIGKIASGDCLGSLGIKGDDIFEARMRRLAVREKWSVGYLESTEEFAAMFRKLTADELALIALAQFKSCKRSMGDIDLIYGLKTPQALHMAQTKYRSKENSAFHPLLKTEPFVQRDLVLRSRVRNVLATADAGTVAFVGMYHVPYLSASSLHLPAGSRVLPICK